MTGSRQWRSVERVLWILREYCTADPHELLHGDCRGADKIADHVGRRLGWNVRPFPADWAQHGKAAGPIRNRQMLDEKPDVVIAFHKDLAHSKGTKDCYEEAQRRGIKTRLIDY